VKWDSVIIDVGSPKPDTEFEAVKAKVAFITPVPGGVGPVTIVSLLENVVEAAERTKAAE
jgi:methylenetetrahydrofolate dehydrogenase (NADP+)/methenyltetrahydrofolate cyclohydrolase